MVFLSQKWKECPVLYRNLHLNRKIFKFPSFNNDWFSHGFIVIKNSIVFEYLYHFNILLHSIYILSIEWSNLDQSILFSYHFLQHIYIFSKSHNQHYFYISFTKISKCQNRKTQFIQLIPPTEGWQWHSKRSYQMLIQYFKISTRK